MNLSSVWQALQDPGWIAAVVGTVGLIAAAINFLLIQPIRNRRAHQQAQQRAVRELLYFLKNKRVLENPHPQEEVEFVKDSVLDMRKELVKTHNKLVDEDSDAARLVDEMRAACVQFLRQMQSLPNVPEGQTMFYWKPEQIQIYAQALDELRKIFSLRRNELQERYGVRKMSDCPND